MNRPGLFAIRRFTTTLAELLAFADTFGTI